MSLLCSLNIYISITMYVFQWGFFKLTDIIKFLLQTHYPQIQLQLGTAQYVAQSTLQSKK